MSVPLHFTHYSAQADANPIPLVMAHGLLGQGRNFGTLAKGFAETHDVFVVDMRNHGDSPWDDEMSYAAMAADLADFIDREAGGYASVFGHSMGGKAAMRLALDHSDRVAGAIIADIAPVAYTHSHSGQIEALQSLDFETIRTRKDADVALKEKVADPVMRGFLMQNLRISADGITPRSNLAVLRQAMADLVGWAEPKARKGYEGPTLFVAGGASDYVDPSYDDVIRHLFSDIEIERIKGAGHWIHAEKPKEVFELTKKFMNSRNL